jgi:hypothetical protein
MKKRENTNYQYRMKEKNTVIDSIDFKRMKILGLTLKINLTILVVKITKFGTAYVKRIRRE